MKYSPKLQNARKQIEAILKQYDIAGVVILHTPGFCEYVVDFSPSYSCAGFKDAQIEIRNRLHHFNYDVIKQKQVVADTVNMFENLHLFTLTISNNLTAIAKELNNKTGASFSGPQATGSKEQNN